MPKFIHYILLFLFLGLVTIYWFLETTFYCLIIAFVISIIIILFTKSRFLASNRFFRGWTRMKKKKEFKVLLVEDELLHTGLIKSELKKAGHDSVHLVHVTSGESGLEVLPIKQNGPFLSL